MVASYAPAFALEPGTWYTVSASAVGNRIQQIMRATGCLAAPRPSTTRTATAFATWNYKDDSGPHW